MDMATGFPPKTREGFTITGYKPEYKGAFIALNRQWIEFYFRLEALDLAQLENPEGLILGKGGEILFVLKNGVPVGTCALIPEGPGVYELAKMAVDVKVRGQGAGDVLMIAAIDWARAHEASAVTLLSNTKLAPAIALYKKHGFETVHLGPHPHYERCNIEMILKLR